MSTVDHVNQPVEKVVVKFPASSSRDFLDDLRGRVNTYFTARGISRKANGWMVLKTVLIVTLAFTPYALILTNDFSLAGMLGLAVIMGFGVTGIGFVVGHDALHGAYSSNKNVNSLLGLSFDLMGASSYFWKLTHNVIHHTYTNIQGLDEDLEVSPLLRLSPRSEHRPVHTYQHLYAPVAYSMGLLYWAFVKDYHHLSRKALGPYRDIRHPTGELVKLFTMKLVYYVYMIVIPLVVLDVAWWQFVIGYMAMGMTAGFVMSIVTQMAHVIEGPEQFTVRGREAMEDPWAVHEMKTTANFARRNKLFSWYVGGLNYQVEHHLFPKICSIHYPAIAPIVQQTAKEYGLPYHDHATLVAALRSHWRTLKRYGTPPATRADAG